MGARVLTRAHASALRVLFSAVVTVLAVEMLYRGATGRM
jgi:hypothetical protein